MMVVVVAPTTSAAAQSDAGQDKGVLSPAESAVYEKYRSHADVYEHEEAEAVLRDWFARNPGSARACGWLADFMFADFYDRAARFDDGMRIAQRCVALDDPKNPASRQTLANKCLEKASRDPSLTDGQKRRYADLGLEYADLALRINPNLVDSLVVKSLLLRLKAATTDDETQRNKYVAEAQLLAADAADLRRSGKGDYSGAKPPPPPPPPTPAGGAGGGVTGGVSGGIPAGGAVSGLPPPPPPPAAIRVGGEIKEPRRTRNVGPVYPEIAKAARVQGTVIMECTIGPDGKVVEIRVLRGIPLLDQAAIDAVKQWEYTPTLLNGVPVSVIMTVTVTFKLS
jgi:TonB family protein